jgi:hypothetical protein
MKWLIVLFLVLFSFGQACAAIKSCEELKAEIVVKIDAAGVRSYVLEIVRNDEVEIATADTGEVVGSCEGGTKKIVYTKR